MKFNTKILILTIVLLAMVSLTAVSAADDIDVLDDSSGVLSVSQDETIQLDSNDYNKTVYIDSQGDDSGAGTEKSPYASLNKAISNVDASDNAVIYMGAGIYTGENNTNLKINLAHKNYNGSLTIIGAGNGKTIIDANLEAPIFSTISADSIVILKDITFINGKNNLGSAISNDGDLTIDSCVFENNSAGAYAAVYQNKANNLKVVNSVFRNNNAGSANVDIYGYMSETSGYNVTLINSSFYNAASSYSWGDSASVDIQATNVLVQANTFTNVTSSGKSSLYVRSPNGKILNNTFKDCSYTGSSGAILYFAGNGIYLEGNKFENCSTTSNSPIYALMNYNAHLAFNDKLVEETTFKLTCNLTDDMGNAVDSYYKVSFYLDGVKLGEATSTGGVATLSVNKLMENGNYSLTGDYGDENPMECEVKNATVTVDFDHNPMDVWVSATGNDTTGKGTETNPFQTIKAAIDYALGEDSVEITVHVKDGIYNITGDYGLSYSDVVALSIIGENYGKAVIDGNNANGFLTSGQYTDVLLQNLTFVNGTGQYSRSFNVRYLTMKDCIVNNIGQLYAQNNPSHVVFDNVIWTNTKQLSAYDAEIYNSHFENITSSGTGNLWLATSGDNEVIIENSKFINMVCTGTSGAGVAYVQGNFRSVNNTYDSNKATSRSYGALYVSANKIVSINDTFINNQANENYGAACFYPNNANATLQVINAKFINNTAGGFGGALGIYGGELINCTFENNTAATLGGAIYMPTHSTSVYLSDLTLTDVKFTGNGAENNGQDIYIVPSTNANNLHCNLIGMTVSINDLNTTTLQDFVVANVTHESGAVIGGGAVTFYSNGSYMGVADVVDGFAVLDYIGFKTDGTFPLSCEYNLATNDTVYNNATLVVALAPLKDNVTLYVSDSKGDDINGTGTLDNPFKTIKAALNSGYKQSAVIVVRVLEGNYTGDLNNNLTLPSSLDISIVGDGQGKTIIDGQDVSWFMKILAGDGFVTIANMTVANITKNYVDAKLYNQMPALTIENGAVVFVEGVEFVRCHGTEGGAIFNEGTLSVTGSRFFNNGDSSNGAAIKNMGTLTVYKSEFIANHAKYYSTIYNDGNMYFYDSVVQDAMRVNGWTGNALVMGGKGNITMANSTISRSGKTSAELIGTGQTWSDNPGFVIGIASTSGTVKVFDSLIDGNNKGYTAQYVSNYAFGGTSGVPLNVEVSNTRIVNVLGLVMNSKGNNLFDSCYIENVTNAHASTSYDFNLTVVNSYFADGTTVVQKKATANVDLNNNWWGSNDKPVYKVGTVNTSPDTWLVLALEASDEPGLLQDVILSFQVTDGENVTDFYGWLYPREFTMSVVNGTLDETNGTIVNDVYAQFKGIDGAPYYIEATVDGQTLNLTKGKVTIGVSEIFAEDIELIVGETEFDVIVLVDNVSASNFNITLIVNNTTYVVPVFDGIASFEIEELPFGNYTLSYSIKDNDVCYASTASANLTVLKNDAEISFVSNVTDQVIIILTGVDDEPLAGVEVSYSIDGKSYKNKTDDNGQIVIDGVRDVVDVIASYDGDAVYNPISVEQNVTVFNGRKDTKMAIVSVDGKFNVEGILTDVDGNPIANATIDYKFGNNADKVITDEKGAFAISAENAEIVFSYAETFDYKASNATLVLKDIAPVRLSSQFNVTEGTTFETYAVETGAGEKGALYAFVLRDSNGNPIANATVTFAYKTVVFNSTTDENGTLYLGISTYLAQDALCAMSYLGDETHNATFVAFNFKIQKKPTTITAAAKTYKASKKYKYLTVTLKTIKGSSRDGKTYLKKGKKITLTVNGKTYKGYTNANGKVTFTITNLNKKGKYTAVIKFAGSDTYTGAKTKVKLKVK